MKKILLLLTIVCLSQTMQAQSSLTVFSEDGNPFYLILNGVRQNSAPETNIRVDGLFNEYYKAKIVFDNTDLPSIEKGAMMVVDADGRSGDVTYVVKRTKRGKMVARFYSFTPYQSVPVPPTVTVIEYNTQPLPPIGTTTTTTQTTTTTSGNGDSVNVGVNMGGVNIGMDVNINGGANQTTTTTTTTTTGIPTDVVVVEEPICYTMTDADFRNALQSIESKSFSDSKLTLAKQVAQSNCLTAGQIKQIMLLFDFEDTRLEYAKFAYGYCFDPENYWKVNDAFQFESSIEELNDYIGN